MKKQPKVSTALVTKAQAKKFRIEAMMRALPKITKALRGLTDEEAIRACEAAACCCGKYTRYDKI